MQKVLNFFKQHKVISIVIVLAVIAGGYGWYKKAHGSSAAIQYVTAAAEKTTITAGVSGSGQVSEQNKVDIKPLSSGRLVSVNVKQGQTVKAGQVLATIDERTAALSLTQAKTQLASAQANYDKLAAGATGTDVQLAQAQLDAAKNSLDSAQANLNNVTQQQNLAVSKAYTDMLNAGLIAVPSVANSSTATATLSGTYAGTQKGQYVLTILAAGDGAYFSVSGLESASAVKINRGLVQSIGSGGLSVTFSTTGTLSNGDTWTITLPNTQASSYLASYNSYQSALQDQAQAIQNAQSQIKSAQINLEQAQATYDQKLQPAAKADLDAAQAQIQNAEASLQSAELNYDNNIIKAPFNGVVAALNNNVGDQVSASDVIATVITQDQVAELSLNEVDVSKIKVGQKAVMTFDAVDGLSLTGTVAQIDTLGTVTQGVVTYAVKVKFDTQDDRIKPGMSVNTVIITDVATDVIAVPNSAVKSGGGSAFVQVLDASGKPANRTVQTGISNDTLTEITSGLEAGDKVITQTINPNIKTGTASSGSSSLRIPGLTGGAGGGAGGGGFGAGRGGAAGSGAGFGGGRGN